MFVTYDNVRGLAAKAGIPYEITKHVQSVSPPRHTLTNDDDDDDDMSNSMLKNVSDDFNFGKKVSSRVSPRWPGQFVG